MALELVYFCDALEEKTDSGAPCGAVIYKSPQMGDELAKILEGLSFFDFDASLPNVVFRYNTVQLGEKTWRICTRAECSVLEGEKFGGFSVDHVAFEENEFTQLGLNPAGFMLGRTGWISFSAAKAGDFKGASGACEIGVVGGDFKLGLTWGKITGDVENMGMLGGGEKLALFGVSEDKYLCLLAEFFEVEKAAFERLKSFSTAGRCGDTEREYDVILCETSLQYIPRPYKVVDLNDKDAPWHVKADAIPQDSGGEIGGGTYPESSGGKWKWALGAVVICAVAAAWLLFFGKTSFSEKVDKPKPVAASGGAGEDARTFDDILGKPKNKKKESKVEQTEISFEIKNDTPEEARRRADLEKIFGGMSFAELPNFAAVVFCNGENFYYDAEAIALKGVSFDASEANRKAKSLFKEGDVSRYSFSVVKGISGGAFMMVGMKDGAKIRTGFSAIDVDPETCALEPSARKLFSDYVVAPPKSSGMDVCLEYAFSENIKNFLIGAGAPKGGNSASAGVDLAEVGRRLVELSNMRLELEKLKSVKKPELPKKLSELGEVMATPGKTHKDIFEAMIDSAGTRYKSIFLRVSLASWLGMDPKKLDGVSYAEAERFYVPREVSDGKPMTQAAFNFLLKIYAASWHGYVSKFISLSNLQRPQNMSTLSDLRHGFEILELCEKAYLLSKGKVISGAVHASGALARKQQLRVLSNIKSTEELRRYIDDITHLIEPAPKSADSPFAREFDQKTVWTILFDKIVEYSELYDKLRSYNDALNAYENAQESAQKLEKRLSDIGISNGVGALPNSANKAEIFNWLFDERFGVNIAIRKR